MTKSELISEILSEWAYRVDDGQPNPKNKKHLAELSIVLSEMGLSNIKDELFEGLLYEKSETPQEVDEADKQFTNPILNKSIKLGMVWNGTKYEGRAAGMDFESHGPEFHTSLTGRIR